MRIEFDGTLLHDIDFHNKYNGGRIIPFKTMSGTLIDENSMSYKIAVHGIAEANPHCFGCGIHMKKGETYRKLGYCPNCLTLMGFPAIENEVPEEVLPYIKNHVVNMRWSGTVPKMKVKIKWDSVFNIVYIYKGKQYHTETMDTDKLFRIKKNADKIITIKSHRG